MNAEASKVSQGWFFRAYRPDPLFPRTPRGAVLVVAGGFLSLMFGAGAVVAPLARDPGGAVALLLLTAPVVGLSVGAMVDGVAMWRNQRITLLGRLAVFAATVAILAAWAWPAYHFLPRLPAPAAEAGAAAEPEGVDVRRGLVIKMQQDGTTLANGRPTSIAELSEALQRFKAVGNGEVLLQIEAGGQAPPQATRVIGTLLQGDVLFCMEAVPGPGSGW